MVGTNALSNPRLATCKKEVGNAPPLGNITSSLAPPSDPKLTVPASPPTVPTSSAASATPKTPPPDGGRKAWFVVLGATVSAVHTWGLVNSFGVFQTYYERELFAPTTADGHPHVSSSAISWIGSVQGALLMMGGVVSGPLFDMGHLRLLLATGHGLVVLGMFLTSVCTQYYQLLLAQGVCVGLGCGLLYLPAAAAVGQWFEKRRALAMGVQSVGSPIAGVVLPIIFSKLQALVGFGWTTRIIAFILLALSAIPLIFLKSRVGPYPSHNKRRAFVDWTYFSDAPIMVFTAAIVCAFLGLWVPFFYVQLYAIRFGVSSVAFSPSYFVTLLNLGSAAGRVLPPWAAVHAGSLNTILGMTALCAATGFLWLGLALARSSSVPGLVVFSVLYGVFQGGLVSLLPSSLVPLTPDLGRLGTRMGTNYLFSGLAVLAGTPVAGAILGQGADEADWRGLIAYAGATLGAGSVLMVVTLLLHRRQKNL
ncbi:hypothetical protein PG991_015896 [Apiospora marii]|uniref:Major facilitator superfamily (MFS) profile domain-containing protein n=1 Tax=Apiospora marii TaxID=335849 RepID=A0ABR1QZY7_9PEZI